MQHAQDPAVSVQQREGGVLGAETRQTGAALAQLHGPGGLRQPALSQAGATLLPEGRGALCWWLLSFVSGMQRDRTLLPVLR